MSPLQFDTTLGSDEDSAFFIEVPGEVIAGLGKKKKPPVKVTLNGFLHRTTVSVYGEKYYLPVRKEIRLGAGLKPGDPVTVTIELDEEPRVVELPEDFGLALAADSEARVVFDKLSFTHRREYVEWITGAKRDETRVRRIEKAIKMLRDGRKEP